MEEVGEGQGGNVGHGRQVGGLEGRTKMKVKMMGMGQRERETKLLVKSNPPFLMSLSHFLCALASRNLSALFSLTWSS